MIIRLSSRSQLLFFAVLMSLQYPVGAVPNEVHPVHLKVRTLCVFDIVGKSGENFIAMQDYRIAAMRWGVNFELKAYANEKLAAEDFKAGICDAVNLTGLRARSLNSFSGTLDSIGSMPTYLHLKTALGILSYPEMAKFMKENGYEVVGIMPGGAGYLFVNDKRLSSVENILGKKVAVLDFDESQTAMAESVGASPVSVSVATLGPMFNNGAVDVIAAPAVAFQPLELYKGIGQQGGIGRFPVGQLTFQILVHENRFPAGFGQKSRALVYREYDKRVALINTHTRKIPEQLWMDLSPDDQSRYAEIFRQVRLMLRDEGFYNAKMLKFLSRVRCKLEAGLAECTAPDRE